LLQGGEWPSRTSTAGIIDNVDTLAFGGRRISGRASCNTHAGRR
jgi:hypothetical protein